MQLKTNFLKSMLELLKKKIITNHSKFLQLLQLHLKC